MFWNEICINNLKLKMDIILEKVNKTKINKIVMTIVNQNVTKL